MNGAPLSVHWHTVLWLGVAGLGALAFLLQLAPVFPLLSVFSAVLVEVLSHYRERNRSRVERLRAQIEGLYGPQVARAKTMLDAVPGSTYKSTFRDHMERVMGELQWHLAEDSTLATINQQPHDDPWALNLARVFVADHRRLVDEYRRLVP